MPATKPRRPRAATTTARRPRPAVETLADLFRALGGVSAERVRLDPPLGTATAADVVRLLHAADKRVCELVDGTLVEKAMSFEASYIALLLGRLVGNYVEANGDFGIVAGADGGVRFAKGLVRFPDVSFVRLDRLPGGVVPRGPLLEVVPDLAVEALSPKNTRAEIARKLGEYFAAGVRLAWVIDPASRTVRVFTAPDAVTELTAADTLTGGDVLPGFAVPVAKLFAKLPPPKKRGKKKPK